jgi:DNA-binding transcriptional MerR regulator
MSKYPLAIYPDHSEVHFERRTAARLAKVSKKFIRQCETEELIKSHTMIHGRKGLCFTDVAKLKVIRHFYEDMGLGIEAVDFVLRYRKRIETLKSRVEEIERQMHRKENEYQTEIQSLRRQLAQVSHNELAP